MCCSLLLAEETWLQWRGPRRDGVVAGPSWPERLDESRLKLAWRVPLGASYSGPLVDERHVYVTESFDSAREGVRALDRKTGSELWRHDWPATLEVIFIAKSNGDWIRSTPALEEGRLFVGGMVDQAHCLDAQTGEPLWECDFLSRWGTGKPPFGNVASPLVLPQGVFFFPAGGLACLDKQTGEIVWRAFESKGGAQDNTFGSPILATIAGKAQLVVQTRESLAGVDPESGDVLWSHKTPAFQNTTVLTPTVIGDRVFTSAYGGGSWLIEVTRDDAGWQTREVWKSKVQGYMTSPLVIDDHIYLYTRSQRFTCLELATGKDTWTTKPYGKYWSLVAQGDRILALDERGELRLIRANPAEFELLDERQVSDESAWAHLTVAGNDVLVRGLSSLSAFRWE